MPQDGVCHMCFEPHRARTSTGIQISKGGAQAAEPGSFHSAQGQQERTENARGPAEHIAKRFFTVRVTSNGEDLSCDNSSGGLLTCHRRQKPKFKLKKKIEERSGK